MIEILTWHNDTFYLVLAKISINTRTHTHRNTGTHTHIHTHTNTNACLHHKHIHTHTHLCTSAHPHLCRECPGGAMVKAMNCGIVVSEFKLQSCYYVNFPRKKNWETYEPPYPPSYWLNYTSTLKKMALALNNLQRLICH